MGKTDYLNLRVSPEMKEALRLAAHNEHRSLSNMVEYLIRGYCRLHGIAVPGARERHDSDEQTG